MRRILLFLFVLFLVVCIVRGIYIHAGSFPKKEMVLTKSKKDKKSFQHYLSEKDSLFIHEKNIFTEGWDTLAQPKFWYNVMNMSPDTMLVNVAATRSILMRIPTSYYMDKEKEERESFKDSVKKVFDLPEDEEIYVTFGRSHFYRFREVMDSLNVGIDEFKKAGVNPWYAQVILMIESPNQLKASPVGAYGGFQLMKSIAVQYGLKVNKEQDERVSLRKSAKAAARLIQEVCIPKAKEILAVHSIKPQEDELWFRLMVLHVYHAGAKNVGAVVKKIKPKNGGIELIQKLWKTQHRNFGNASQNYSQLALASQISLDKILREEYDLTNKL